MTKLFFILLLSPFVIEAAPAKVEFFRGNLSSAKTIAANEGKLYFAEFSASWCAPCRVLEETTFSDPKVVDYIAQNYIPVKVDIDDFDGIALKQVYNVRTIPTIIVFNSKGQLLEKYEEALPTSKMLALLERHNTPENRIKTVTTTNVTVNTSSPVSTYNQTTTTTPVIRESHSPMKPASSAPSRPDKRPITPVRTSAATPSPAAKPMPQGDGLYRFTVAYQPSQGYSVQIGAFKEYGNVLREVARVQDDFEEPIIVHIIRAGNETIYKILVGEFVDRPSAISYQSTMKQQGVEGVIKDLSTMK